jgi:hypothetical protein
VVTLKAAALRVYEAKSMKRAIFVFISVGVVIWGAISLVPRRYPQFFIEAKTKDFGLVIEGKPLIHVFKFSNQGSAPLDILRLDST